MARFDVLQSLEDPTKFVLVEVLDRALQCEARGSPPGAARAADACQQSELFWSAGARFTATRTPPLPTKRQLTTPGGGTLSQT